MKNKNEVQIDARQAHVADIAKSGAQPGTAATADTFSITNWVTSRGRDLPRNNMRQSIWPNALILRFAVSQAGGMKSGGTGAHRDAK